MIRLGVAFLLVLTAMARADSPFSVEADQGMAIRLNGRLIARANLPSGLPKPRLDRHPGGLVAAGEGFRQEAALFDDRLEYTVELLAEPPLRPWAVLFLPLGPESTVNVVHGTPERPPETTALVPAGPQIAPPVRFITVSAPPAGEVLYSLDTQPAGAMGDDPANAAGMMRALICRRESEGLELRALLAGRFPARVRAKFIFYAPARPFAELHPFVLMNYRNAFEKVARIDFSAAPPPRKSSWRAAGTTPYQKKRGYGWLGATSNLELAPSELNEPIYGQSVGSRSKGTFRVDLPPGHYYLTLNFGHPERPVGPLRVSVNGQTRINRLALAPGRFKAEVLWITSLQDHLAIELEGLEGAAWQLSALTASALGTLNEDFTLTRPWWNLPSPRPGAR